MSRTSQRLFQRRTPSDSKEECKVCGKSCFRIYKFICRSQCYIQSKQELCTCIFAFFHMFVPDRRSPYRQFRIPRIVIPRFLNFAFQQNYCKAFHKFVKYSQHCQNSFLNVLLEYSSWKVEMSKSLAAGNIDLAPCEVDLR